MTTQIELKPTLSPSALGNYELCGRRGQYYHQKIIPGVTTPGLALGGAWHRAMETFQQARMQLGDNLIKLMPHDLLVENLYQIAAGFFAEQANKDDFEWTEGDSVGEVHERLHLMLNSWALDSTNRWLSEGYNPVAVEHEIVVEMGSDNHVMRGFVDLVLETPVGVIGVDHKTAGRAWGGAKAAGDPRKLIQAPLYAEGWLRQTGQEMTHFVYDVMTYAGKFQRVWVDVSREVRAPFLDRWHEVSDMISLYDEAGMEMPTNPSNNLCSKKWCNFWDICPMGAQLDRRITDDD
jgi:hypothetical protein